MLADGGEAQRAYHHRVSGIPGLPQVHPRTGMPAAVRIVEVGPRDGLQNEPTTVPVEVKAELIRRLRAAGLQTIETTSFVNPTWVPQLADAEDLLDLLGPDWTSVDEPVLVPNERGLERALSRGVRAIAIFGSATETFAQRNLGRSRAESVEMFRPVVSRARDAGMRVRAYLSMCFGDPWEGPVPAGQVAAAAAELMALGCDELSIGDTIGVATPGQVLAVLEAPRDAVHAEAFNIGATGQNHRVIDVARMVAEVVPGTTIRFAPGAGPDPWGVSHVSRRGMSTVVSTPFADSSKVISRS